MCPKELKGKDPSAQTGARCIWELGAVACCKCLAKGNQNDVICNSGGLELSVGD